MQEGVKLDSGKVMMHLLPPLALRGIAEVFTFGAKKYASWNWAGGLQYCRLYDALQRHLNAWFTGDENDPESGKSHLFHAGCCLMMLAEMQLLRPDLDDRPKHYKALRNEDHTPEVRP